MQRPLHPLFVALLAVGASLPAQAFGSFPPLNGLRYCSAEEHQKRFEITMNAARGGAAGENAFDRNLDDFSECDMTRKRLKLID